MPKVTMKVMTPAIGRDQIVPAEEASVRLIPMEEPVPSHCKLSESALPDLESDLGALEDLDPSKLPGQESSHVYPTTETQYGGRLLTVQVRVNDKAPKLKVENCLGMAVL